MKEVIVHLGLHKTASGTLQRQFFPACRGLSLYTTAMPEIKKFVLEVTRKDPLYFSPESAFSHISSILSDDKPNLLSNESLSGPPFAGAIELALDHRSPILMNLRSVFPEARAILVLRRQDSLARSFYRQYLKSGGVKRPRRFYGLDKRNLGAIMSTDRFLYAPYVDAVKKAFPSGVLLLAFEEFLENGEGFLRKLVEFIGVEMAEITLHKETTTTLGPFGLESERGLWLGGGRGRGPAEISR
jgi:hypothetical protein